MAKNKLSVGDKAPDFVLYDQEGRPIYSKSFLGRPHILFFYPRNFTKVCTSEACLFRDRYYDFMEAGAEVIGVTGSSIESNRSFAASYDLPYSLLSDPGGEVRKRFGAQGILNLYSKRITFVINPQGKIAHYFESMMDVDQHIESSLAMVRAMEVQDR